MDIVVNIVVFCTVLRQINVGSVGAGSCWVDAISSFLLSPDRFCFGFYKKSIIFVPKNKFLLYSDSIYPPASSYSEPQLFFVTFCTQNISAMCVFMCVCFSLLSFF